MRIRKLVARSALAGLAALSLGWFAGASEAPCVTGFAKGAWDLPRDLGSPGWVDGLLFDLGWTALYHLTGTLTEVSTPCLSCREGELTGFLDDGVGPGPDFEVRGTWLVGSLSGKGQFEAVIYKPVGPALVPVGRMHGVAYDPLSVPNAPGILQARWGLCP